MTKSVKNKAKAITSTVKRKKAAPQAQSEVLMQGGSIFMKAKELYENPALRHIAGGLASAALARYVKQFTTNYPELTNLIRESLESVENKLVEFKSGVTRTEESADLQH